MTRRIRIGVLALLSVSACATPPPPTQAARKLAQNPHATVEGRVTDAAGRPATGVRVQAVPGGRDVFWTEPTPVDADGRFRLTLDAPAEYLFLIFEGPVAVLTPAPDDPARVHVFVEPGKTRSDVALTWLPKERAAALDPLRATAASAASSSP